MAQARMVLAILVGVLAITFWGFSIYDMQAILTGSAPGYLAGYPDEMIAWVQGFPTWRTYLWGASLAAGLLGGLLVLIRGRFGAHLLTLAWAMAAGGYIGHDLVMADGFAMYGEEGIIASSVLLAVAAALAIGGHWATAGREA